METKFKDVAHFYIGSCIITNTSKQFQITGIHKGSAKEIICSNVPEMNKQHFKYLDTVVYESFGFDECKIILRPLIDITEFEALELGKMVLDKDVSHVCVITKNANEDSIKVSYSNGTEFIELTDYYISCRRLFENEVAEDVSINNYNKLVVWLTSKGFDVFGLIKSMEAITIVN